MKLEVAIQSRFKHEKEKAAVNVLFTGYWLRNSFSSCIKQEGITLEQYNVLRILKGKHPEQMRVKDIAGRILERSSNVPRIVDKLVNKKLAKRSQSRSDKRETLVSLTDKGIKVLAAATMHIDAVIDAIDHLDGDALIQLNELLDKMREGANAE